MSFAATRYYHAQVIIILIQIFDNVRAKIPNANNAHLSGFTPQN